MPITVPYVPRKFSWLKVPDASLVEGRISIPFGLQVTDTGDGSAIQLPTGLVTGHLYSLDARTIQNVQTFSAFKSIDFVADFKTVSPNEIWGSVYIFSPDSGECVQITPADGVDGTLSDDESVVIGSIPITSNAPLIQLIFALQPGAGNLIKFSGNANNFEHAPFVYSSHANV